MATSSKIAQSLTVPFVVAHDGDECSIEVGFEEDGRTPYIAIHVIDSDTDAFKECRVTGGVLEITQPGSFYRDRWNTPSSTKMRASSDAALVVNMARKHRTAIQDALMTDQKFHEWSEPQRTNMRNFFTTMLGVPMSFAQTRVR